MAVKREDPRPGYGLGWFEQMGPYVKWRIVAPQINTPFSTPISDRALAELASNRESLKRLFNLKCLCDGFEILEIKNVQSPSVFTDHPCLSGLSASPLFEYLESIGVSEEIEQTVDRLQEEIRSEMDGRDRASAKTDAARAKTRAKKKALEDKAEKDKAGENSTRIVRK